MSDVAKVVNIVTARVVSKKMDKTVVVEIVRKVRHELYNKYIKRFTHIFVHDEANQCNEGDLIAIVPCRPIAKNKSWKLVEVVETANRG